MILYPLLAGSVLSRFVATRIMEQWASFQLAAMQQHQQPSSGILSHQPYSYSSMLMDQSSVNAKPPSLHPPQGQLTASGAGLRPYNMSQTYHALPPEAARSVTANIQVSCDKLTHQLCSDVDFLMQQMIKTIDDAKHHLKMAVYTLGKHLHDGVMPIQQLYPTDTNSNFPQICYDISWELVKAASGITYELMKALDLSNKELVQTAKNVARQVAVDLPEVFHSHKSEFQRQSLTATRQSHTKPLSHVPHTAPRNQPSQAESEVPTPLQPRVSEASANVARDSSQSSLEVSSDVVTAAAEESDSEVAATCTSNQPELRSVDVSAVAESVGEAVMTPAACDVAVKTSEDSTVFQLQNKQGNNSVAGADPPVTNSESISASSDPIEKPSTKEANRSTQGQPRKSRKRADKGPFKCDECNKVFKHKKSHRIHMMRVHTHERPHQCQFCEKRFVRAYERQLHEDTHSGKPKFKCEHCSKEFFQKASYELHVKRRHSTSRQFVCTVCSFGFVRKCDLKVHMKIHVDDKKYVCDFCNRAFLREKALLQHRTLHTGDKMHSCKICAEQFTSLYFLSRHVKLHKTSVKGKFKCQHCTEELDRDSMQKHVLTHKTDQLLTCVTCKLKFSSLANLLAHRETHTKESPFVCPNKNCVKSFSNAAALEAHQRSSHRLGRNPVTSRDSKKYATCKQCGKSVQKSRLESHMNCHTGKKPYMCDQCPRQYSIKKSLQVHVIVKHNGVRPYGCLQCSKRFPTSYSLKEHQRTHNKKHKCNICDRTYSTGKLLLEHMAVHTGEKLYSCKLCCESFSRYAYLLKHCKSKHKRFLSGEKIIENKH